jgi:arylformamidase
MSGSPRAIFLDYTQDTLDRAYNQTHWAPNADTVRAFQQQRSAQLRERLPHYVAHYGRGADETVEIFPTARAGAPVVLFVHGGSWLPQPHNAFVYFADTVTSAGAHLVAARFSTLAPTPGKLRMPDMIDQLRRCVVWLYGNAAEFGGGEIHLVGHSSGAHLASVLLTTDWPALGAPINVLASGTCVSGMYDLRPVLLSARGDYVKLSAAEEDEFSAIRHVDRVQCPLLVAYGERESPEFQRHARSFAAALTAAGRPATLLQIPDSNHFEIIASMTDPHAPLAVAVMRQLGLSPTAGSP